MIAFDVCKFSSYPGVTVTFDETYTGTINGKIVYDSPDAKTHQLIVKPNQGTLGVIESSSTSGAADAAKNGGITVSGGSFIAWFDCDEMFTDHAVTVYGLLEKGPQNCQH